VEPDAGTEALTKVVLQTDWFPQPEHGGFYQALAKGYYQEAGLDVEILSGGPNAMTTQQVLRGRAHFAMNRADTIHQLVEKGVEAVMIMATLQHDPQAVMLHASNPIQTLQQLDGQRVMAIPGLMWIRWLEARYGISLTIIPHDFGMERFMADPSFIQQCLVTNEPFFVRQHGIEPKVLPLRDSGFDPYHGIYCLRAYADAEPETVRRFVAASIRGWQDFIANDPRPAFELIAARNPKMTGDFMRFSWQTMKDMELVTGVHKDLPNVGRLDPLRLDTLVDEMQRLGLTSSEAGLPWYDLSFMPVDGHASGSP
jgi:NitT/TauT family transport system substrate-binding protein